MDLPHPDFAGAAHLRAQQSAAVQDAVSQGRIAPDIGAAMSSDAAGNWLLSTGFEVVGSLEELHGPSSGTVTVPDRLTDRELPGRADLDQPWQRQQLYRRLLLNGTADEQRQLLNRTLLKELWPTRPGPVALLKVWEDRFPELADRPGR